MKRIAAIAFLSCLALVACQQDTPAPQTANPKPRRETPAPAAEPGLLLGLDAEQTRKMKESMAMFADLPLGQPQEIMARTEHKVAGTDLTVEFIQVKRDSRCPSDVQCAWAGEVVTELSLKKNGKGKTVELGKQPVDWSGYRFTLHDVLPHPAQTAAPAMPRMLLAVDKAQGQATVQDIPGTTLPAAALPPEGTAVPTPAPSTPTAPPTEPAAKATPISG